MTDPAPPSRAEEDTREPGQIAYEARFAETPPRCFAPWAELDDEARAVWVRVADAVAARASTAEAEVARLTKENDHLRASLANSGGPCPYCELPQAEWAKCASGFPGCARADDAMLCPNVGAWLNRQERIDALEEALKPFAAVCDAEPMRWVKDEQVLELVTRAEVTVSERLRGKDIRAARAALTGGSDAKT